MACGLWNQNRALRVVSRLHAEPRLRAGSRRCQTHQSLHALHVGGADGQGFFVPPPGFLQVPPELGDLAAHVQDVVGHREEVGSFLGAGCGFCRLPNANVDFSCEGDSTGRCFSGSLPCRGPGNGCNLVGDIYISPTGAWQGPIQITQGPEQANPPP